MSFADCYLKRDLMQSIHYLDLTCAAGCWLHMQDRVTGAFQSGRASQHPRSRTLFSSLGLPDLTLCGPAGEQTCTRQSAVCRILDNLGPTSWTAMSRTVSEDVNCLPFPTPAQLFCPQLWSTRPQFSPGSDPDSAATGQREVSLVLRGYKGRQLTVCSPSSETAGRRLAAMSPHPDKLE